MDIDLLGSALGPPLTAAVREVSHQSLLPGIHRDHQLPAGQEERRRSNKYSTISDSIVRGRTLTLQARLRTDAGIASINERLAMPVPRHRRRTGARWLPWSAADRVARAVFAAIAEALAHAEPATIAVSESWPQATPGPAGKEPADRREHCYRRVHGTVVHGGKGTSRPRQPVAHVHEATDSAKRPMAAPRTHRPRLSRLCNPSPPPRPHAPSLNSGRFLPACVTSVACRDPHDRRCAGPAFGIGDCRGPDAQVSASVGGTYIPDRESIA